MQRMTSPIFSANGLFLSYFLWYSIELLGSRLPFSYVLVSPGKLNILMLDSVVFRKVVHLPLFTGDGW